MDPPRPHPHVDLHDIGTALVEEGNAGLAGHCFGHQGLAHPRRPRQQNPLGEADVKLFVAGRFFEEVNDLPQIALDLLTAGHIVETDPGTGGGDILTDRDLPLPLRRLHPARCLQTVPAGEVVDHHRQSHQDQQQKDQSQIEQIPFLADFDGILPAHFFEIHRRHGDPVEHLGGAHVEVGILPDDPGDELLLGQEVQLIPGDEPGAVPQGQEKPDDQQQAHQTGDDTEILRAKIGHGSPSLLLPPHSAAARCWPGLRYSRS